METLKTIFIKREFVESFLDRAKMEKLKTLKVCFSRAETRIFREGVSSEIWRNWRSAIANSQMALLPRLIKIREKNKGILSAYKSLKNVVFKDNGG